jgi:hypothetical protein
MAHSKRSYIFAVAICVAAIAAGGLAIDQSWVSADGQANSAGATEKYVTAYAAQASAAHVKAALGRRMINQLIIQVGRECGGVLAGAPPRGDKQMEAAEIEITGALDVTLARSGAPVLVRFAHAIGGLHWANRVLSRRVIAFSRTLDSWASALPSVPRLCADLRYVAARGFHGVSSATVEFDHRVMTPPVVPAEPPEETDTAIAQLLLRYESQAEHRQLTQARRLVARTGSENLEFLNHSKHRILHKLS